MLYVCYDNEGYMNTGYQRSSTTLPGLPHQHHAHRFGINGKTQQQKYVPLILAMHNVRYLRHGFPLHMADMVAKIQKGLAASKRALPTSMCSPPVPLVGGMPRTRAFTMPAGR